MGILAGCHQRRPLNRYSENRVDDANREYLSLRKDIKDDDSKNSPAYHAMAQHEHERTRLRKELKRLQEKDAAGAQISAARRQLQNTNKSFVEKWGN